MPTSELGAAAAWPWSTVEFFHPNPEPSRNRANQTIIGGGLPIGNGETAALVFPVAEAFSTAPGFELRRGVHLWLGMTTAMASDAATMPLGVVSIETYPPIVGGARFRHALHLENASVTVASDVGSVTAYVDARTNRVVASVRGARGRPLTVSVTASSLRPEQRFAYSSRCQARLGWASPTSAPDVWGQPAAGALSLMHRNDDDDVALLGRPAAFNATLEQQGLGHLADELQGSDRWRHRAFGFVVSASPHLAPEGSGRSATSRRLVASSSAAGASAEGAVDVTITTLAEQAPSVAAWERRAAELHETHRGGGGGGAAAAAAARAHGGWWDEFWNRSHIHVWAGANATNTTAAALRNLTARYAQTRYLQAIQAGTWVPIKFNGQLWTAQLPPETNTSGPSFRDWGAANWWQNTRLAYGSMLLPGDYGSLTTIFDYYLQMVPLLSRRTAALFNHSGLFTTETKTLWGLYDPCDYGDNATVRATAAALGATGVLPPAYQNNTYLRYDFGGDAGLPELSLMVLDWYEHTMDDDGMRRYLPLLVGTLDFFAQHYGVVAATGTLLLFPTQALETYQCPFSWPPSLATCPANDHPTVAALHVLTERALALPEGLTTAAQRDQWRQLRSSLPAVPLVQEGGTTVVSPYETYPLPGVPRSNVETPELYSTHPFRYFSVGSARAKGRDLNASLACLENSTRPTCRFADSNSGWTQGVLNAALLGRAARAAAAVVERAATPPAVGYRFPAFMGHMQDYQPSSDHLAVMSTALQLMLLAPSDDGAGGALLFPAWPCEWDVDFKLHAPRRTTVRGRFVGGALVQLDVLPPERLAAIEVLPCQRGT